jgi:hypothetical protein
MTYDQDFLSVKPFIQDFSSSYPHIFHFYCYFIRLITKCCRLVLKKVNALDSVNAATLMYMKELLHMRL